MPILDLSRLCLCPVYASYYQGSSLVLKCVELAPGTKVKLKTEISPEGLTWCDHEAGTAEFSEGGMISVPVENTGPYMRLRISLNGDAPKIKTIIYLTLRQ